MTATPQTYLDFEKPIADLEGKIRELRHLSDGDQLNITAEVTRLQSKVERLLRQTYKKLSPQQVVQVARHPDRPHFKDYVSNLISDFVPLAGDRLFGEDHALIGGLGRFQQQSVVVMGQEKGSDTESRVKHNFGMTRPEGYRKAQRLMEMAEKFQIPIITMVDTAGAYPGVGAEERGQSEAIARSVEKMLNLSVPVISIVIGEGGSGGAIAIAAANKVYMLEYSIYSVISPEGCASILWRSGSQAKQASEALRLTAPDLQALKVIDGIIKEPMGGAHRNREDTYQAVEEMISKSLSELNKKSGTELKKARHQKFIDMGKTNL